MAQRHQADLQSTQSGFLPAATNNTQAKTQDPPPITYNPQVNTQNPPPAISSHQVSIQDPLPTVKSHSDSIQDPLPIIHSHRVSIQDPPSATRSHRVSIQDSSPAVSSRQESFQEYVPSSHLNQIPRDNSHNFSSGSSTGTSSGGVQKCHRHSMLSVCWWLLHEAKKISRQLSLVLSLAGVVIITLITLVQPWVHFQVPLRPPGDPAGSLTMLINTIFFVRCPDISCWHEYDYDAYFLDLAWAFLIFSSITSLCLYIALMSTIFFTSSNHPKLDFFIFITSILTGTGIVLGILFYLLQAHQYLQEGMGYQLGPSFYLAWTGVFLFLMTGFFSYLNYMNFWSILATEAIWT